MKSLIRIGGVALAFALESIGVAEAQRKMTYEEAFAKCQQEIGLSAPGNETLSAADRYSAGNACMRRYGFRLKTSAKDLKI